MNMISFGLGEQCTVKSQLTRHLLAIVAMTCGLIPAAARATIIDDFSADTSANYTLTSTKGTGGFSIDGASTPEQLRLSCGSGETTTFMRTDSTSNMMQVRERWSIDIVSDMPDPGRMVIAESAASPVTGTNPGFKFRRDTNGFRVQILDAVYDSTEDLSDYFTDIKGSPATVTIGRASETEFHFWTDLADGSHNYLGMYANDELAGVTDLYVGAESYGTELHAFDNLTEVNNGFLTFQQGTAGYDGTVDTHILSDDPTVDKSVEPKTRIVGMNLNDGEIQGLIRFDDIIGGGIGQIPAGATISSAVLHVKTGSVRYDGTSASTVVRIHQLLQNFDDTDNWSGSFGGDGVQFDDVEAAATADFISEPGVAELDGSMVSLDVTTSLQAWANGETNNGWVIAQNPDGANNWYFDSAEGTLSPMLEVTFTVATEEPIAGDANKDGKVDGSDVTILAGNWQAGVGNPDPGTVTWEMGDFNGDGQVDGSDVTILAGNWQAGVTAVAATVPEPSVLTLLGLGSLGLWGLRRKLG